MTGTASRPIFFSLLVYRRRDWPYRSGRVCLPRVFLWACNLPRDSLPNAHRIESRVETPAQVPCSFFIINADGNQSTYSESLSTRIKVTREEGWCAGAGREEVRVVRSQRRSTKIGGRPNCHFNRQKLIYDDELGGMRGGAQAHTRTRAPEAGTVQSRQARRSYGFLGATVGRFPPAHAPVASDRSATLSCIPCLYRVR